LRYLTRKKLKRDYKKEFFGEFFSKEIKRGKKPLF